jgi:hypothetical protein
MKGETVIEDRLKNGTVGSQVNIKILCLKGGCLAAGEAFIGIDHSFFSF